ncbi:MAG: serpin family protein [Candidatus Zipacnadales bacterium]
MKRRRALSTMLSTLMIWGVAGCKFAQQGPADIPQTPPRPAPPPKPPVASEIKTEDLAAANTAFGIELLQTLLERERAKNVVISPSSLAFALTMTYNGAAGETAQAMAKVLHVADWDRQAVNEMNAALRASLAQAEPHVELTIANSLWAKREVKFLDEFMEANRTYFEADLFTRDFADPDTLREINNWLKKRTGEKIPSILDRIDPLAILFLINAVYFNGKWEKPFQEDATEEKPFTLLEGTRVQVPMMRQFGHLPYTETENYQAVGLPYKGGRIRMVIVLPKERTAVGALVRELDAAAWQALVGGLQTREGELQLPRYTVEYEVSLKEALSARGMGIAFKEDEADFTKMSTSIAPIWIGEVKHKVFVEVNERGTEAAAATSVGMVVTAAPGEPEKPFQMIVDHPFLYAICDTETNTVLFVGVLVDPRHSG